MGDNNDVISIRRAVDDDLDRLMALQKLVRKDDPEFRAMYPLDVSSDGHSIHTNADWLLWSSIQAAIIGVDLNVGTKVYVGETAGKEIVGYSVCHSPESPLHLRENRTLDMKELDGINSTFIIEHAKTYYTMIDKHVKESKYWDLDCLIVHPHYKKSGIASKLVAPIFEAASRSKETVWITSSSTTKEMYEEVGCELIESADMQNSPTGNTVTI